MKIKFLAIIATIGLTIAIGYAQTNNTLTTTPNPFKVSTDITIQNLNVDTVTLKIYDRWGSLIVTFFENIVLSGSITITFNADTLPDGQYLASLRVNSENIGKMIIKDQNASGLTDKLMEKSIVQVYPNPTVDRLTISADMKIIEFKLYDAHGRQLLQSRNEQQNTISMKNFDNGLYFLHLKTSYRTYIKKIIKK
jgi:alpha-D-ribose 1-methylphosphonate 5-phosphate C-P lyase